MKRKNNGKVCMFVGAALVISALLLLSYNRYEDDRAGHSAQVALPAVQSAIPESPAIDQVAPHINPFDEEAVEQSYEMTVTEIDGYDYIGYLSIPVLDLELPVMSEWSYPQLKIAPCRQFGSTKSNNLVIAGHNYNKHFGRLSNLNLHDVVQFTDMEGKIRIYQVGEIAVIPPNSTDEVKHSEWDLILYTCTYGGRSRIIVGCTYSS